MKKEILQEILAFAKDELDFWKQSDFPHAGELEYLGKRKGIRYYTPYYPEAEMAIFQKENPTMARLYLSNKD